MWPIVTNGVVWSLVCLSVCWSVCLSVTIVSTAKTAAPIEMPFDVDSGGPNEPCIGWVPDPHTWRGQFRGENWRPRTCTDMSCGRYTQSDSAGGSTETMRMPIVVY